MLPIRLTRPASALAAALLTLGLAACADGGTDGADGAGGNGGNGGNSGSHGRGAPTADISVPPDADYNAADVAFAQTMIPHHAQALMMVDLTVGRGVSPRFQRLVNRMRDAQSLEIEQMAGWLRAWDQEVPETMRDHLNAEGHGDADHGDAGATDDLPGMLSQDDLQELGRADDADFERRWLEAMVVHHDGAVEMARTQVEDGRFAEAVELAQTIERSQTKEIASMQRLLDGTDS